MAQVTFDLATKVIANDQTIWAVFPGRDRRFLDLFRETNSIFLDFPGIALTPQVFADDNLLRRHVGMSYAIAGYRRGIQQAVPGRNPLGYEVKRDGEINKAVGILRGMFVRMKVGDLVVIGGKSLYEPFIAGEIVSPFSPADTIELPYYGLERVPVRKVRWLRVNAERRILSQKLSHLLSNRTAVITIGKEEFGDEIYKLVYGDYVFGDDGRYVFPGPKYNNIARQTIPGINLLSYFIAANHAHDEGEIDKFAALDLYPATENYFHQEILHSFELEFASPGEYVIYAKQAGLALLVALCVAATSGDFTYAEAQAATIVNSADHHGHGPAGPDTCPVPIKDKFHDIMGSLGAEKFNKLCALNKDAQAGVGLKTNVKAKKQ